jgi:probable phosphoglycerate mutase
MIYAVRHGETYWNAEGRIQGHTETHLTPLGIAQAEELRERFQDVQFDVVFCSTLVRARHTCEIILRNRPNVAVEYLPELRERDFGEMVGKIDRYMTFWNTSKPRTASGVESIAEMEARIFPFLRKLIDQYQNKNVLVVTHIGPLFIFENFFGYAPPDGDYTPLQLKACGYRIYDPIAQQKTEHGLGHGQTS